MTAIDAPDEDLQVRIRTALNEANHTAPSAAKYATFERLLAQAAGLQAKDVYATHVSKAGNASVRMVQSARAQQAVLVVAVISDPRNVEGTISAIRRIAPRSAKRASFVIFAFPPQINEDDEKLWEPVWACAPNATPDGYDYNPAELLLASYVFQPFDLEHYSPGVVPVDPAPLPLQPVTPAGPGPINIPLVMDDRVLRMVRTAIVSSRAVMLVGPPGTGKSTLVRQIASELAENPASLGMERSHELFTVTADESWTTRELVGGDSIDRNNELKFAPGYVLQSIMQDRWLFLDEANRADLDRIFGGLLSWLSGQRNVIVGRLTPTGNTEIALDWSGQARSVAPEDWNPDDYDGEDQITFAAGNDWRLIGTYNSLDAHRVFQMGLALGRRFAQIPIPPPSPSIFAALVEQVMSDPDWIDVDRSFMSNAMNGLYRAHYQLEEVALGPALFLELAKYVKAAISIDSSVDRHEVLAEAYLASFGTWLSRLPSDDRDELGQSLVDSNLLGGEWDWVEQRVANFA